jgi:hypothetical protein
VFTLIYSCRHAEERNGWCTDPNLPPCAAFVEIMAPVFSRKAWRCVWHMIQNDLIHGWGLDFAVRKCVQNAHEKIGVVDAQWIIHQGVPSLGNQVCFQIHIYLYFVGEKNKILHFVDCLWKLYNRTPMTKYHRKTSPLQDSRESSCVNHIVILRYYFECGITHSHLYSRNI